MKLITRNTDYAVRALCYLAGQGSAAVSVTELVARLRIPRPFLRKLLQTLGGEGILRSTKGQGGGFSLAKSPENIRLTDLIRIFQGGIQLNECIFKRKICPNRATCVLKREIDGIEQSALQRLEKVSIALLIRKGRHHDQ
ncbi:MAG TPA: Rrf2 family transcriptional regulator [Candidatus Omnitrophota bacterium]|nr:Rrf2 family transcriptional regulator [Candidatus Omnitrophota bacterium]HPS36864.1 Rrf2 family transcriptional regulator [Candidatus Omnitrophota bacterium]